MTSIPPRPRTADSPETMLRALGDWMLHVEVGPGVGADPEGYRMQMLAERLALAKRLDATLEAEAAAIPAQDSRPLADDHCIAEFRRAVRDAIHPTAGMCGPDS